MKNKTLLFSPLALIPLGSQAAVAGNVHPAAPTVSATPSWTGFYVGANLGGISARSSLSSFDPLPGSGLGYCFGGANPFFGQTCSSPGAQTATGVIGGGQIGYNFESASKWVYGAELDFDFSGARQQTSALNNPNAFLGTWTAKTGIDDFGTARLRLGYDFNNIMPFVTGGLAYGNVLDTFQGGSGGAGVTPGPAPAGVRDTRSVVEWKSCSRKTFRSKAKPCTTILAVKITFRRSPLVDRHLA